MNKDVTERFPPRDYITYLERVLAQVAFELTPFDMRQDLHLSYSGHDTSGVYKFDTHLVAGINHCIQRAKNNSVSNTKVVEMLSDFPLRVEVETDLGVVVQGFGIEAEGREVAYYPTVRDTPEWMQQKIATLMLIEPPDKVEGIGMRANDNVYWLGDEHGDTRSESEEESNG